MVGLLVVAGIVFSYGLVSDRLRRVSITGPMVFLAVGIALGSAGLGVLELDLDTGAVGVLAEATLVLLLFTDAIRIDPAKLRRDAALPVRMLLVGLPLTVAFGTAVGSWLLPGLGVAGAFVLAAVLAPTDAALGQAVVGDERLPVRVRQTINVESGLNDGLALPVVTVAAAAVAGESSGAADWVRAAGTEIGVGVAGGLVMGWVGGRLLDLAASRGWVGPIPRQLATLSIGVAAFAGAEALGGNGFVGAFVAGLAFAVAARGHCDGAYDFAEDEGVLLALLTFLAFGAAVASDVVSSTPDPQVVLYVVLSLTVIRMVPVALSLVGAGLSLPTIGFLGWFGPRGLASVLFAVFVVEDVGGVASSVLDVVTWVVVTSVVLHGISAVPFVERYVRWEGRMSDAAPERLPMGEFPFRGG